jgi:hypothetical protein
MSEHEIHEPNSGICQTCFMLASQLDKHMRDEHGIVLSSKRESELREISAVDAKKAIAGAKIEMLYMGDGPTQPK